MQCFYFHFEISKEQEKIKMFDLKMINLYYPKRLKRNCDFRGDNINDRHIISMIVSVMSRNFRTEVELHGDNKAWL